MLLGLWQQCEMSGWIPGCGTWLPMAQWQLLHGDGCMPHSPNIWLPPQGPGCMKSSFLQFVESWTQWGTMKNSQWKTAYSPVEDSSVVTTEQQTIKMADVCLTTESFVVLKWGVGRVTKVCAWTLCQWTSQFIEHSDWDGLAWNYTDGAQRMQPWGTWTFWR